MRHAQGPCASSDSAVQRSDGFATFRQSDHQVGAVVGLDLMAHAQIHNALNAAGLGNALANELIDVARSLAGFHFAHGASVDSQPQAFGGFGIEERGDNGEKLFASQRVMYRLRVLQTLGRIRKKPRQRNACVQRNSGNHADSRTAR